MRALSKPLSSPGRAEKFPPPLMRILRTNPGSRSRGRSRSSPIFHLRSRRRPPGGAIEAAQEPSSPKVTCIGQVRVRRRKTGAAPAVDLRLRRRRHWLSCGKISCAFPRKPLGRFFRSMFRELLESSPQSSRSPPRNALLLTRCRSAPYRSSSLGGRFWAEEKGEIISKLSEENSAIDEPGDVKGEEIGKRVEDDLKNVDNCKGVSGAPLMLTRCKSEPAWRGERLGVVDDEDDDYGDTVEKG
ncbi:arabidopsis thaliana genomic DNA [Striga asiatica]|uniref:Arabidopsis thaliana genomic DNA n=1 Tax=Striga asiatica TaxID=4170 RepID=A0A5A7P7N8_STRAF|nr:arabidopsis thaliana genomic DNA [Striga asiatica]